MHATNQRWYCCKYSGCEINVHACGKCRGAGNFETCEHDAPVRFIIGQNTVYRPDVPGKPAKCMAIDELQYVQSGGRHLGFYCSNNDCDYRYRHPGKKHEQCGRCQSLSGCSRNGLPCGEDGCSHRPMSQLMEALRNRDLLADEICGLEVRRDNIINHFQHRIGLGPHYMSYHYENMCDAAETAVQAAERRLRKLDEALCLLIETQVQERTSGMAQPEIEPHTWLARLWAGLTVRSGGEGPDPKRDALESRVKEARKPWKWIIDELDEDDEETKPLLSDFDPILID